MALDEKAGPDENVKRQLKIRAAKQYTTLAQGFSGAFVVGGATFALGFMINPTNMKDEVLSAFALLFMFLSIALVFVGEQAIRVSAYDREAMKILIGPYGLYYAGGAAFAGLGLVPPQFAFDKFGVLWWLTISGALILALGGLLLRSRSNELLDMLCDEDRFLVEKYLRARERPAEALRTLPMVLRMSEQEKPWWRRGSRFR